MKPFYLFILILIPTLIFAGNEKKMKKVEIIIVNDFEKGSIWNSLENRSGPFQKAPSSCFVDLGENKSIKKKLLASAGHYLILSYIKGTEGGPGDTGGWCGWYTLLKTQENIYLNLTGYNYIRFYYRPLNGSESFIVGMADRKWDLIEDSVHIQNSLEDYITKRFKSGWMEITIPLYDFANLNLSRMSSFAIIFDSGKGTVYLDNIIIGFDKKYESINY